MTLDNIHREKYKMHTLTKPFVGRQNETVMGPHSHLKYLQIVNFAKLLKYNQSLKTGSMVRALVFPRDK